MVSRKSFPKPQNANPILPQWRKVKPFLVPFVAGSDKQFVFAGPAAPIPEARAAAVAQFLRETQVAPNLLFTSLQQATLKDGAAPLCEQASRAQRRDHARARVYTFPFRPALRNRHGRGRATL